MSEPDRIPELLDDLRSFTASARKIVKHGRHAFEDADGDVLRLAAKAILIDLSTFADRLPERYRAIHPAVPWRNIRGLRNFLAHDYDGTDFGVVWGVIANDLPAIAKDLLGDDSPAAGR